MSQINKEYAEALFAIAKEANKESEVFDSLKFVSDVFSENPVYIDFLSTPSISKKERLGALSAAFANEIDEDVLSFVSLLCSNGQIRSFSGEVKVYEDLYRMSQKISVADVYSAVILTEEEKEKLKRKLEILTGNDIQLNCCVDKSLIGGISVKIDDKIIDGSVKHRIDEIKEVIDK